MQARRATEASRPPQSCGRPRRRWPRDGRPQTPGRVDTAGTGGSRRARPPRGSHTGPRVRAGPGASHTTAGSRRLSCGRRSRSGRRPTCRARQSLPTADRQPRPRPMCVCQQSRSGPPSPTHDGRNCRPKTSRIVRWNPTARGGHKARPYESSRIGNSTSTGYRSSPARIFTGSRFSGSGIGHVVYGLNAHGGL